MAQLNFPPFTDSDPNPENGDIWTAPNGTQWEYDISIPAWKALANPGPGIKYRGGIDLTSGPNGQYDQIVSGNFFAVTVGSSSVNGTRYPGLDGLEIEVGSEIIFDGAEYQFLSVQIPYATKTIAGKVELATLKEAEDGDNDTKALTPQTAKRSIPEATTEVFGKTQYATRFETDQATREDRAVTPYGLSNILELIADNTANQVPVGMIMWYTATQAPDGWLICNGQRILKEGDTLKLYQHLKGVTNTPWNDGDIVKVPDLRGRFIRGNNLGVGRDPADPKFGEAQVDNVGRHRHDINDPGHDHTLEGYKVEDGENRSDKVIIDDDRTADPTEDLRAVRPSTTGIDKTENFGEDETRVKNLNLLPCIKL